MRSCEKRLEGISQLNRSVKGFGGRRGEVGYMCTLPYRESESTPSAAIVYGCLISHHAVSTQPAHAVMCGSCEE